MANLSSYAGKRVLVAGCFSGRGATTARIVKGRPFSDGGACGGAMAGAIDPSLLLPDPT